MFTIENLIFPSDENGNEPNHFTSTFFFFSAYQKLLWEWNEDGSQDADASAQPPSCFTEMLAVVTRDFVAHLRGLLPPW